MNLVPIYKNDDLIISIDKTMADYLEKRINSYFILHKTMIENVIELALDNFVANGGNPKGKKVISTDQIPIFHRGKIFEVQQPYDCFEEAILLISAAFDNTKGEVTDNWKKLIQILVSTYYSTQLSQFCLAYFPTNCLSIGRHKISGILTFEKENVIIILPFELNEDDFYQTLY